MTNAESTVDPALLIIHAGATTHVIEPGRVVTIGRDPKADVHIDDPQISRSHLRLEYAAGQWQLVDNSLNGMFIDGLRRSSATVTDGMKVRLADPDTGQDVGFELVAASDPRSRQHVSRPARSIATDTGNGAGDDVTGHWEANGLDPGVVRAGAAAAARRRELDISQRRLAAEGIINAGALIAFEKGRSWPREKTRAKLEEVLQWPAGTIGQIRRGAPAPGAETTQATPAAVDEAPLIAHAIVAAVDSCTLAVETLPLIDDPNFTPRVTAILADLRSVEAVATRAAQISTVTPALIRALSTVRRHYDQLQMLGATSPGATLGQRLYAARRRANLSIFETAQAAGVAEDVIARAEAEEPLSPAAADAIETLISEIDWH